MLEIKSKLKIPRSAYRLEIKGRLRLSFAARRGGEALARLEAGEEALLRLPGGEILRGGDLVTASDGRVLEVLALPEKLLHAACASPAQLARIAWHLGSDHVAVEIGKDFLRVAADGAIAEMLRQSGATVSEIEAPFEAEVGAGEPHVHGHEHDHGAHGHGQPHDDHPHKH
jgi:urease accessory protein